ncbi:hypothetical protein MCR_0599 [Moraxella catarrhalis BBH18]|nr:hypothetical protein MCR_0599 [Moraxella catarrhalis BBH18]
MIWFSIKVLVSGLMSVMVRSDLRNLGYYGGKWRFLQGVFM